jgi:hypothetical protein
LSDNSLIWTFNSYDGKSSPARLGVNDQMTAKTLLLSTETVALLGGDVAFWLTPVKANKEQTASEVIQVLVGDENIFAFGERTPGRQQLKPGDWICFYESTRGVVAHARIVTQPEKEPHPKVRKEIYPWTFKLDNAKLYLNNPIVIDVSLRQKLDAFRGRDPAKTWAWFVQATHKINEDDFKLLTVQTKP